MKTNKMITIEIAADGGPSEPVHIIDTRIKAIIFKKDRNARPYVRIIVSEPRTLDGIAYNHEVSYLAFGDLVEKAKTFKRGQQLRAIVNRFGCKGGRGLKIHAILET